MSFIATSKSTTCLSQPILILVRLSHVLTDRREALFFVLHYLKAYPTLECMGLYFGMSVQAVSDYLKRTKAYLRAALEEMDQMPPSLFASQQDFDQAFQGVDYLLIDATEVRVNRSKRQ